MTKVDILTPLQQKCLAALFADEWFRRYFYLTGGTALSAFYLHHRLSDDLDFFCHEGDLKAIPLLMDHMGKVCGVAVERIQTSPGFMRFLAGGELKIDVVADVGFRVGIPELRDTYMVDNFKNIAVNKVCAILGRLDAKDYVDLFFIFKKEAFDIFELLALGEKKDAGLDPFTWASVIADVEQLAVLPRMIVPIALPELRTFFFNLRDRILDAIRPRKDASAGPL